MLASAELSATVQPWPQSRNSSRFQCKNPLAWATCLGGLQGQLTEGSKLGRIRRLDFQLNRGPSISGLICNATNTAKNKVTFSSDELTESQLKQWQESCSFLEGQGLNAEEVDKMLRKAFGWVQSPYWSEKIVQTVPDLETVSSKVDFLKALGFSDVELVPVLKKFPELLGCRETLMKHNLGVLEKEWGIAGKSLKSVVKRNPHVLGYNVDCKGDCMAQCTRCWVRF